MQQQVGHCGYFECRIFFLPKASLGIITLSEWVSDQKVYNLHYPPKGERWKVKGEQEKWKEERSKVKGEKSKVKGKVNISNHIRFVINITEPS